MIPVFAFLLEFTVEDRDVDAGHHVYGDCADSDRVRQPPTAVRVEASTSSAMGKEGNRAPVGTVERAAGRQSAVGVLERKQLGQ